MALSICNTVTDPSGRELLERGVAAFPAASYCDAPGQKEVPWHWHEDWEVIRIIEGCAELCVGKNKYTLCAGEGVFINSGVLHAMRCADDMGCRFHSLVFHPRLIGGSIDSVFHQSYVRPLSEDRTLKSFRFAPSVPWQQAAIDAIECAWQSCVREPAGYEFKVRAALSELVLFVWEHHIPGAAPQPSAKMLRNGERIKIMLQFIHDHYAEELSTKQIAASALISESECLRCFRSTIGITPIQYVKQYRIGRAAHLLTATQDKIADIAARCGFQDFSYFTKTFREQKGCVPTEYRNKNQIYE